MVEECVMTNPFENENASYYVLCNDEGQYSLWPDYLDVPNGWQIAHGPAIKKDCNAYIETVWTDMRPKSLIRDMQ
jgi:MbtH protein